MLQAIECGWLAVKWKLLEFYFVGKVISEEWRHKLAGFGNDW